MMMRRQRDQRVANMPDDFLDCRAERHALVGEVLASRWRHRDADTLEKRILCVRCGSYQVREVVTASRTLEPGALYRATWYDYAEGYLNPLPGTGRIPYTVVRLEATRRFLDTHPLPIKVRAS